MIELLKPRKLCNCSDIRNETALNDAATQVQDIFGNSKIKFEFNQYFMARSFYHRIPLPRERMFYHNRLIRS